MLVETHIDKANIHSHLVINSVNFETGEKYQQSKQRMEEVKEYSRKLCLEAGLKVITNKSNVKDIKINEYKAIEKLTEDEYKEISVNAELELARRKMKIREELARHRK